MEPDNSINADTVTEDDVKDAIDTIHTLRSAFGDSQSNLDYLARVLEVLYGVEYELDSDDMDNLDNVIEAISSDEAIRLDPTHVEEKVQHAQALLAKVEGYEYHDRFEDNPVVSYTEREDIRQ